MLQIPVSDVRAVDYEDDGVAGRVVALPEFAQGVLAAYVPDLEVHVWHRDRGYVLSDCGHGFELGVGVGGEEERFDLFVEGRFAGIVEAEEKN